MTDTFEAPPSLPARLAALDVGETAAVSRRIGRASPEGADLTGIKNRLRSSINPTVSRHRKAHNRDYEVDCGEFLTTGGHIVVSVAITRIM